MIKNTLMILTLGLFLLSTALYAGKPLNKQHKGLTGKDGAKVNCVYCHKTAGNPKTEGNDLEQLKKGPYCNSKDCHGKK